MKIPQIKDKITARAFALYLSIKLRGDLYRGNDKYSPNNKTVIDLSEEFEKYLIGDAELPEVSEDINKRVLDMWSSLKESSERSNKEVSKWFEELHANTPFRANNYTEPKLEDIQNETH